MTPHLAMTRSGSTEILIALCVVTLISMTSFVVHLQTSSTIRNLAERNNRIESSYTNEVLAWHSYYRAKDGLQGGESTLGKFVGLNDGNLPEGLTRRELSSVPSGGDTPIVFDVKTTLDIVAVKGWVKRGGGNNLFYDSLSSGSHCGTMKLGKNSYRGCLSRKETPPPPSGAFTLKRIGGTVIDFRAFHEAGAPGNVFRGMTEQSPKKFVLVGTNCDPIGVGSQWDPIRATPGCEGWRALRLDERGALDRSFGVDGITTTDFGGIALNAFAHQIAVLPDKKILLSGGVATLPAEDSALGIHVEYHFAIAQYDRDGHLDLSFGEKGKTVLSHPLYKTLSSVKMMKVQEDGKIILGGILEHKKPLGPLNRVSALVRLSSNGTIDAGFGEKGWVTFLKAWNGNEFLTFLKLQPDGKILVGGATKPSSTIANPSPVPLYPLYRLNSDGSLDGGFGNAGKVELTIPGFVWDPPGLSSGPYSAWWDEPEQFGFRDLHLYSDGKMLLVGGTRTRGDITAEDGLLVRLNANGSLDTSFDTDGFVGFHHNIRSPNYPNQNSASFFSALLVQDDGRILAFGSTYFCSNFDRSCRYPQLFAARFQTDGSVDTSFGAGGAKAIPIPATQPDENNFLEIRSVGTLGSIIPTFVQRISNGNIYLMAKAYPHTITMVLDPSLNFDTSYGVKGVKFPALPQSNDFGFDVAFQSEDRVIVGGISKMPTQLFGEPPHRSVFAAVNTKTSSLDLEWGGQKEKNPGSGYYCNSCNTEPLPGRVKSYFNEQLGSTLVHSRELVSLKILDGGKILTVGGSSPGQSAIVVARYLPNGAPDTSFGKGGALFIPSSSVGERIYTMAIQPDGKILLAGGGNRLGDGFTFMVLRLLPSGQLDATFGNGGKAFLSMLDYGECRVSFINSLALQSDGKIVASGISKGIRSDFVLLGSEAKSLGDIALARFNPDGTPDESFGQKGAVVTDLGVKISYCDSMTSMSKQQCEMATRGLSSIPPPYMPPTQSCEGKKAKTDNYSNDHSYRSIVQRDGKIVVGGCTAPYTDQCNYAALLRYNENGSIDTSFGVDGKVIYDYSPLLTTDKSQRPNAITDLVQLPDDQILTLPAFDPRWTQSSAIPDWSWWNLKYGIQFNMLGYNRGGMGFFRSVSGKEGEWVEPAHVLLALFAPDGTPNANFGTAGVYKIELDNEYINVARALTLSPKGKIAIVGTSHRTPYKSHLLVDLWEYSSKP